MTKRTKESNKLTGSNVEWVDSHCHIHDADFPLGISEVMMAARDAVVTKMIVIGTDEISSNRALDFAHDHENVWAAVGVHPHDAKSGCDFLEKIDFTDPKIVAVGEIGLDYHYNFSSHDQQKEVLIKQLEMAKSIDLPVVFHVREAFDDFWPIYDQFQVAGVLHSYSDNLKNLTEALSRGLYIGVNGIATFTKKSEQLEAFSRIPLERLLVETDAPFLSPKGRRGQVNQPAYVRDIAQWLAEFYGVEFEKLAMSTTKNSEVLFGI